MRKRERLVRLQNEREVRVGVRNISRVVDRFFLFVGEILAHLDRDRREKAVAVQNCRALETLRVGAEIDVDLAVVRVVLNGDCRAEVLVFIFILVGGREIGAVERENVHAADRVVPLEFCFGVGNGDRDVAGAERVALKPRLFFDAGEVVRRVVVEPVRD